ncbi:hypothetical protein KKF63_01005 [bacterium]|nr:hypothetical protein [bacterium]
MKPVFTQPGFTALGSPLTGFTGQNLMGNTPRDDLLQASLAWHRAGAPHAEYVDQARTVIKQDQARLALKAQESVRTALTPKRARMVLAPKPKSVVTQVSVNGGAQPADQNVSAVIDMQLSSGTASAVQTKANPKQPTPPRRIADATIVSRCLREDEDLMIFAVHTHLHRSEDFKGEPREPLKKSKPIPTALCQFVSWMEQAHQQAKPSSKSIAPRIILSQGRVQENWDGTQINRPAAITEVSFQLPHEGLSPEDFFRDPQYSRVIAAIGALVENGYKPQIHVYRNGDHSWKGTFRFDTIGSNGDSTEMLVMDIEKGPRFEPRVCLNILNPDEDFIALVNELPKYHMGAEAPFKEQLLWVIPPLLNRLNVIKVQIT